MLVKKQMSKRKTIILASVLMTMIIATFIVLYNSFLKKSKINPPHPAIIESEADYYSIEYYESATVGTIPSLPASSPAITPAQPTKPTSSFELSLFGLSTFRYTAPASPPEISYVSPTTGPTEGGTVITIVGSNFGEYQGQGLVTFNGTPAASYTSWSNNQIIVLTPPHAKGLFSLEIKADNALSQVKKDAFSYVASGVRPEISSISPTTGPTEGGTVITIVGSNFGEYQGRGLVTFNNTPASSYAGWSDNQIVVLAPPHLEGSVVVVVKADNSLSSTEGLISAAFKGLKSYVDLPVKIDPAKVGNKTPFVTLMKEGGAEE